MIKYTNNFNSEKFLYPNHPVRCIITGPSECGQSVLLTNLFLYFINEYDKIYIYSPSLHQDLYQKLSKCFSKNIPIHIIPNILNDEDIDLVIEEIVINKDFEKSDTEIETYESIEDSKFPQEYENNSMVILDGLNEKAINNDKTLAMFKRGSHNNLSVFIISHDYYELPKRTIRANGNIYHIFKANNSLDVRKIYQNKASMDMTLDEFKYFTSSCWDEKYQSFTIDMTKVKHTGRYRLGLNSLFVPNTSPFYMINSTLLMSNYSKVTEQDLINLRKFVEQQKNQQALKIKTRNKKPTHENKLAENLSTITKKLDIVNESTQQMGEIIKESSFQNETTQLAFEKTPTNPPIENDEGVMYDVELEKIMENIRIITVFFKTSVNPAHGKMLNI